MPFYPQDWLADRNVGAYTYEEQGVYMTLLCRMWEDETGSLPDDNAYLAKLLRISQKKWRSLRSVLIDGQFAAIETDGHVIYQKRLITELQKVASLSQIRADLGRRGGQASASKRQAIASVLVEQTSTKAQANGKLSSSIPDPDPDPDPGTWYQGDTLPGSTETDQEKGGPGGKTPSRPDGRVFAERPVVDNSVDNAVGGEAGAHSTDDDTRVAGPSASPVDAPALSDPVATQGTKTDANARNPYSPEFLRAWAVYPRKVKKQASWRVWQTRLKQGASPDQLTLAAEVYAQVCAQQRTEPQFIMHPVTFWGRDVPYEDYLVPPEKDPQIPSVPPGWLVLRRNLERLHAQEERPP